MLKGACKTLGNKCKYAVFIDNDLIFGEGGMKYFPFN